MEPPVSSATWLFRWRESSDAPFFRVRQDVHDDRHQRATGTDEFADAESLPENQSRSVSSSAVLPCECAFCAFFVARDAFVIYRHTSHKIMYFAKTTIRYDPAALHPCRLSVCVLLEATGIYVCKISSLHTQRLQNWARIIKKSLPYKDVSATASKAYFIVWVIRRILLECTIHSPRVLRRPSDGRIRRVYAQFFDSIAS